MTTRRIVVHGVEIPESLLAAEAQNHPSDSAAAARSAASHALATKALLLDRAIELALRPELEFDENGRQETMDAALVRAVLEFEVDIAPPTDAECRRVYDAQRHRFRSPALYEAAHILIEPQSPSPADDESARTAALRLSETLARQPERFAELARACSDCPSGATGGSLGQLTAGDLAAEVERALMQLAPGQIAAAPVRSRFGWHVLKLDRCSEARDLPFELVADRIRLNLEARAWSAAAARYVMALAEDARARGHIIVLDEEGGLDRGAQCLGDFLGEASAARLLPWLDIADPELGERVRLAAGADGMDEARFVRTAAAAFVREADDEEWTRLLSAARDGADPALAALSEILRSTLRPPRRSTTVFPRRMA